MQVRNVPESSNSAARITLLASSISIALLTGCTTGHVKPALNTLSTAYTVENGEPRYIYCSVGSSNTAFHTCPSITPKTQHKASGIAPIYAVQSSHWLPTEPELHNVAAERAGKDDASDKSIVELHPAEHPVETVQNPEIILPTSPKPLHTAELAAVKDEDIVVTQDVGIRTESTTPALVIGKAGQLVTDSRSSVNNVDNKPVVEVEVMTVGSSQSADINLTSDSDKPAIDHKTENDNVVHEIMNTSGKGLPLSEDVSEQSRITKIVMASPNLIPVRNTNNVLPASEPATVVNKDVTNVTKPVSVYFDFASYKLSAEQFSSLAATLKIDPKKKIHVTGFTDDIGPRYINDALALRRAMSVMQILITMGVPESQIEINACSMCGIESGKQVTAKMRRMHRRVDIALAS